MVRLKYVGYGVVSLPGLDGKILSPGDTIEVDEEYAGKPPGEFRDLSPEDRLQVSEAYWRLSDQGWECYDPGYGLLATRNFVLAQDEISKPSPKKQREAVTAEADNTLPKE